MRAHLCFGSSLCAILGIARSALRMQVMSTKLGGIVIEVAVGVAGGVDSVSNGSGLRGVGKVVGCVDGIVAGAAVVVVDDKIIVIDIVVVVATAGIVDDAAVADFAVVVDVDGVGVFNVGTGF